MRLLCPALWALFVLQAAPVAAFAPNAHVQADGKADSRRTIRLEAWPTSGDDIHVRVTVANGWKLGHDWIAVTARFYSGDVPHEMAFRARCSASALPCIFDFDRADAHWNLFERITVEGRDAVGVSQEAGSATWGPNW
jgi:hypothetical protein